jgi:pyruvate kinase
MLIVWIRLPPGMNVARLNFSHGDFAGHQRLIENLRAAARRMALLRLPVWTIAVSPQSRTC